MAMQLINQSRIKQEAKALKKQNPELKHTQALEQVIKAHGFQSYDDYLTSIRNPDYRPLLDFEIDVNAETQAAALTNKPDNNNLEPTPTLILLETVKTFSAQENVLADFREETAKNGIDFSILIPTETGLKKNILDATAPNRNLFESADFHKYSAQGKGTDSKVIKSAVYVTNHGEVKTRVSLYRPETKHGDPRMWFSKLNDFAKPNDKIAIIFYDGLPYLINLTALPDISAISGFLALVSKQGNKDALELIGKLKDIAKNGPIRAVSQGDTAVGMAVESALGLTQNNWKGPDYLNRIELKAARENKLGKSRKTRQTLFAQVADWGHARTNYKSSGAILNKFGYERDGNFKLYCTVCSGKFNSQKLSFEVSDDDEMLYEIHETEGVVAVWPAQLLMNRLLQKHSETFWIKAESNRDANGGEMFNLKSVIHTKKPLESQLMQLIREGHVTMDHLIKRSADGQVKEKGPLFKISSEGFKYLFPNPVEYSLL